MRVYRILIIDDNDDDRRNFGKLLAQPGADTSQIQQANDGATGLAALRTEQFDCVLLDFDLPDMTGLEFLAAAAVDGELPCAVVLLTGQGSEVIAVEAMRCGAQDYLVKDEVDAANLWRTVTQAVSRTEQKQRPLGSLHLLRAYRLLVVDNDAIDRELYRKLLAQPGPDGFQIQEAATGEAGLAALSAGTFDCLLVDFSLPT